MYSHQIIFPRLICFNMLKYYFSLFLLLYLIQSYSQSTIIAKQGFENSGDDWSIENISTPPCTNGGDTWNYHNILANISSYEGKSFWGIQDLNGNCGSSDFEYIDLKTIDISAFRNVQLSFEVQVNGFDNGDDMKYQLWFDGISEPEVIFIDGQNDYSTDSWLKIQISIPNQIDDLKLRISVKQNGSDTAGLDNFILKGDSISPCQELMISEYIEGSSSTSHRNNYIELYNSSDREIDLSSYKLLKFTGNNTEASELQLSGVIAPYKTFLIEDQSEILNIEADLSTNNSVMDFNGDDKIALQKFDKIIDLIGEIGVSGIFAKDLCLRRKSFMQNPNNQYDFNEWDVYGLENTEDLNFHASRCEGELPEIMVSALEQIISDESEKTSLKNNTYFGNWPSSTDTLIHRTFTIKNTGTSNLDIYDILISGKDASNFKHDFLNPVSISPNDSITLKVSYAPIMPSIHTAKLEILNNDSSEKTFNFIIQGEGTGPVNHPLIISQYYEGNANNKWIEITNTRDQASQKNAYYLALYRNADTEGPIGIKPYRKVLIRSLKPNETLKYSAILNVSEPAYALDGNEIKTSVCGFTGDDILIISTSESESCWADRTDIVGRSGDWGSNLSLVRKYGCAASSPNTGFNESDWIAYSINDIDLANNGANETLGTHNTGTTTWSENRWSNGIPDLNRKIIIADNYITNMYGDLQACSLHVLNDASLMIASDTKVEIKKNLIVDGSLEVAHQGSLIMIEDSGSVENNGILKIHKTTTELNPLDYTYWSSPIENANLETVFEQSPKNSFFIFSTMNFEDNNDDGIDDNNDAWVGVSGDMEIARGYTSMAPNTNPFINSQKVSFKGKANTGIIQVPISKQTNSSSDQSAWNFIGNPYPSALSAEALLNHPMNKGLLYGSLYFWTHTTEAAAEGSVSNQLYTASDYAMYTVGIGGVKAHPLGQEPTNFISSCQGFFVEAQKAGILLFNNAMRSANDNAKFFKPIKDKKENRVWVNLSNEDGGYSQILLGFVNQGTVGYDKQFDGKRLLNEQNISFYSIVDAQRLGIQSLPPFQGDETIKLGLKSNISSRVNLQISLDHMEGSILNSKIILTDNLLGRNKDLIKGPYIFESSHSGYNDNRFELSFSELEDNFEPDLTKIKWVLKDDFLIVNTNHMDSIDHLEVFDLNGRKLRASYLKKTRVEIPWYGLPRRAIYILKVQLSDSRKFVSKILI